MRYTFHGGIPISAASEAPSSKHTPAVFVPKTIVLEKGENYSLTLSSGDKVNKGSVIAVPSDTSAFPIISSVCGTIKEISESKIYIEADEESSGEITLIDTESIDIPLSETPPELLCDMIRKAAVVSPACPNGVHEVCEAVRTFDGARRVIIDCTSAEDYLVTSRHIVRNMRAELIGGIKILIRASLAIGAVIIADDSDIKTIRRLEKAVDGRSTVLLVAEAKYPLSDPKLLMHATIKKECPPDSRPTDFGCAIFDAEACVAVYNAVINKTPMTHRLISFDAKGKTELLSVPFGTRLSELIGTYSPTAQQISFGAFSDFMKAEALSEYVITAKERVIIPRNRVRSARAFGCIKCMKCEDVCPMYLSPYRLLLAKGNEKKLASLGADCCIGCNACSAVCPSGIDIPFNFSIFSKEEEKEDDGK